MDEADRRAVFFFDIDNCVSCNLLVIFIQVLKKCPKALSKKYVIWHCQAIELTYKGKKVHDLMTVLIGMPCI